MTTLESNRTTVLHFCERLSRRDCPGMAELVTPDATWWVIGRPDYAPYGGSHLVKDILKTIHDFFKTFDEFAFTVDGAIAEGNRVVIEATSSGRNGNAHYKNVYLMRYQLHDGKIKSIREFFDAYEMTDYFKQLGGNNDAAFEHLNRDGQENK